MTNPGSLLNFMDFRRLPGVGDFLHTKFGRELATPATWDPSVLIVFATALGTQLPLFQLFTKDRKEALLGGPITKPACTSINLRLILGAAFFGAGWSLAGFCPGPAMASAFAGAPNAGAFLGAVLLGMFASALSEFNFDIGSYFRAAQSGALKTSLLGMGLLSAFVGGLRYLATPIETLAPAKIPTGSLPPLTFALAGGALIGLSGFLYTLSLGKVMGLSGMLSQQLQPTTTSQDRFERGVFIAGLASASLLLRNFWPSAFISSAAPSPLWKVLLSGLMVGFGTACSNGCTSGHGLAGISRLALRSIVATATFFGTNVLVSTFLL